MPTQQALALRPREPAVVRTVVRVTRAERGGHGGQLEARAELHELRVVRDAAQGAQPVAVRGGERARGAQRARENALRPASSGEIREARVPAAQRDVEHGVEARGAALGKVRAGCGRAVCAEDEPEERVGRPRLGRAEVVLVRRRRDGEQLCDVCVRAVVRLQLGRPGGEERGVSTCLSMRRSVFRGGEGMGLQRVERGEERAEVGRGLAVQTYRALVAGTLRVRATRGHAEHVLERGRVPSEEEPVHLRAAAQRRPASAPRRRARRTLNSVSSTRRTQSAPSR